MFADPRMSALFDTRDDDTAVSAIEHAKRVACALLDVWYGTRYFPSLGRGTRFGQVKSSHGRAKSCPMRPDGHLKHKLFTTTQRDTWIGHAVCAAEECGTSDEFQKVFGNWLSKAMGIYGPFADDTEETSNIKLIGVETNADDEKEDEPEEKDQFVYLASMSSGVYGAWFYNASSPKA